MLQLFFCYCGGCVVLQGRPPRLSQDISTVWAVTACLCLLRRRDLRPLRTPVPQPVPQLTCRTCRSHWSRLFNVEGCTGSEHFFANIEEPRPNNPVTRGSSAIGKLAMIGVVQYSFVEKESLEPFWLRVHFPWLQIFRPGSPVQKSRDSTMHGKRPGSKKANNRVRPRKLKSVLLTPNSCGGRAPVLETGEHRAVRHNTRRRSLNHYDSREPSGRLEGHSRF